MSKQKKLVIGITAEGSVNLLQGQLAHFKSLGYTTYLLGPYSKRSADFCEKEGCEHLIIKIERDISPVKDLKSLYQIIKIFKNIKPDIINLGTPKVSLLGMIAGALVGVPKRIYTCRGFRFEHETGFKRRLLISMEKITSKLAHHVICISKSVETLGLKHHIFSTQKTIIINKGSSNGINLALFDPEQQKYQGFKSTIIEKYQLENKFVFGFLGRIVDRKGIKELIEAFSQIYIKNENVRLLLVGPFEWTQISDKNLEEIIQRHPGIIYHGKVPQDEVPGVMLVMDVFVLPAWWEGFGNVLVQAAAMGIPVISSTSTGCKDAVNDGYNGILVPPKDIESLEQAMEKLLLDKNLLRQLGGNGITWSKHFERTIIWNGMERLYKS